MVLLQNLKRQEIRDLQIQHCKSGQTREFLQPRNETFILLKEGPRC